MQRQGDRMTAGTVERGYEPVYEAFEQGAGSFGRGGGAYCAYVGGKSVVDVWGGTAQPGESWEAGTTTVIMSATKALASLCVQLLEDRGQIDINAPVADYWPEFAQAGKGATLVRHVLLHTAGVLGFDNQTDLLKFDGTGWDDYAAISAGFAASKPEWEPGTRHGYHALSYGWLVGEIVRRVSGRSIGRFFADEVAGPLGLEVWIGTPPKELERVARVHRSRTDHLPGFLRKPYEASLVVARDPAKLSGRAFLGTGETNGVEQLELLFNSPLVLGAEFPAGGATSTARAMARLFAVSAAGGELDGVRLLSAESVRRWGKVETNDPDVLMAEIPMPRMLAKAAAGVPRTLGYLGNGPMPGLGHRFGPNPDAYGAEGLGGQFAFCDPDSSIAVGYVRSDLAVIDVLQPRLTNVLYECARRLGHRVHTPPPTPRLRGFVESAAGAYLRRKVGVRP
jgi:CubicO group peptidase (beta-lactamase class C family)